MLLAIIDDNWGLAFGVLCIILAFGSSSFWAKVFVILLGIFFITMNIWKGWFSFRFGSMESDTTNDEEEKSP